MGLIKYSFPSNMELLALYLMFAYLDFMGRHRKDPMLARCVRHEPVASEEECKCPFKYLRN